MPECFFAHLGGCEGGLVKAHLIPKQSLKREIKSKLMVGGMARADAVGASASLAWDPRTWRWMCGGPTGLGGHHGQFDAGQLQIERAPMDLIEFLREYSLEWMAAAYIEKAAT